VGVPAFRALAGAQIASDIGQCAGAVNEALSGAPDSSCPEPGDGAETLCGRGRLSIMSRAFAPARRRGAEHEQTAGNPMLRDDLNAAMKEAAKAKNQRELSTIRLILAALKDRDIAARSKGNQDGISEDEILQMLQSMIKQRRESIQMYEQGGRLELAEGESEEIAVIEKFLPAQMSEAEIEEAAKAAIAEQNATSMKDMGGVMAFLREKYAGRMDFGKASAMVKKQLA
jgi:uncharacterized protein YqeY